MEQPETLTITCGACKRIHTPPVMPIWKVRGSRYCICGCGLDYIGHLRQHQANKTAAEYARTRGLLRGDDVPAHVADEWDRARKGE